MVCRCRCLLLLGRCISGLVLGSSWFSLDMWLCVVWNISSLLFCMLIIVLSWCSSIVIRLVCVLLGVCIGLVSIVLLFSSVFIGVSWLVVNVVLLEIRL